MKLETSIAPRGGELEQSKARLTGKLYVIYRIEARVRELGESKKEKCLESKIYDLIKYVFISTRHSNT